MILKTDETKGNKMGFVYDIINSWRNIEGSVNTLEDIHRWIEVRQKDMYVKISKIDFLYNGFWYYDENDGYIRNKNNSFFQLAGYQEIEEDKIIKEQPIIIQDEIGYLGIICKKINGQLNFLMQAKIEPGNVNKIQISPTIQATKSNFTRMHGGNTPDYLEYFIDSMKYQLIVDQIQSEQSSRFYKKRNRNMIIYLNESIDVLDSHCWMTLGQIKELMKIDNLVNMDTRTVLSCIPFSKDMLLADETEKVQKIFRDKALCSSMFGEISFDKMHAIFNQINDYKMHRKKRSRLVPLKSLKSWEINKKEIVCKNPYDFKVIYCNIEIEGREVKYWEQPLIEANGKAILGIFTCIENGVRKFLVCVKPEIGCFDGAEVGPVIQLEPTNPWNQWNEIESFFMKKLEKNEGVIKDVILSEEGGRFYHEENRNVIIEVQLDELGDRLLPGYFWIDFATLNLMVQFNNCVNIQLRNLLALLDV